ncbi:MAG: response regulator transcription factor [Desulfobulbaceae bacterium]|nr:response regulator transcription factor [Desulfobulbaceae bacterium]
MRLIVCSENEAIRQRWIDATKTLYTPKEATNTSKLQEILGNSKNIVVLLHRSTTDMETIIDFIRKNNEVSFFILSDRPFDNEGLILLHNGATGYANTYMASDRLLKAVEVVMGGSVWVGRTLMNMLVRNLALQKNEEGNRGKPATISDREWQVAERVGNGNSNLEIAAELEISEATVKAHIGSLFKKTNTESRLQLALYFKNSMP